ncbi:DUF3024 domain-containing protein [Arthrobacter sp. CAN_A1]|uniref:DUF3024 domain-containing protein n=1 Tax=Arthrobacter sp. CAN_A1 TaxID=2787717 RepID=UPI0018CBD9FB
MVSSGLPELEVARARRWCAGRVPARFSTEMRVECDVAARHITIVECRPPWDGDGQTQWSRFPIARMYFTKKTGLWTLYWRDRSLKFHQYQFLAPSPSLQVLLDHVDESGDPIFWG